MPFVEGHTPWNKGKVLPAEVREKISNAMKGRPSTFKGRTHTEESRAKMSASLKGRTPTFLGKTHSPESIAKMSATKTGRPLSPAEVDGRRRAAETNRGRKNTPETIAKMKAAAAKRDPSTYHRGPTGPRGRGYGAIHLWLQKYHPKSGVCEDCGGSGGKKGTHYAFLWHPKPHTRERADYMELCPACHIQFDRSH
jgi:hypothetical protein